MTSAIEKMSYILHHTFFDRRRQKLKNVDYFRKDAPAKLF